ncbi:MAG: PEP-CTERM sorting domain-containing protein [Pseudomonadota bacterium]
MNFLKKTIVTAALALGASSAAHATYLTGVHITTDDPYSFKLSVAQEEGSTIDSAKLSLYFSDLNGYWFNSKETISIKFDNVLAGTVHNVNDFGKYYSFNVLPDLLSDGKLSVSISLGCSTGFLGLCYDQDVWLNDVLLAVNRVPTVPSVPATPTTPSVPTPPTVPAIPAEPSPPAEVPAPPPVATLPTTPVEMPADPVETPTSPAEVPEPATLLTLGLGLLGLAAARRRA